MTIKPSLVSSTAPGFVERRDLMLSETTSPRLGRPDDMAALVAFLMSEDAEWINGQIISVDGGLSARMWLRPPRPVEADL
jgi:NAD(P)-dependent dehydrogenase (short-subunit alcohol dehydrogenase family)